MMPVLHLPVTQLTTKPQYQLAPPLSPPVYADLRASIQKAGILSPLLVEEDSDGMFVILDGHHRHRVADELKMSTLPCYVIDSFDAKHQALTANAMRRQVTETQRQEMKRLTEDLMRQQRACLIPELVALDNANPHLISPLEMFRLSKMSKETQQAHHQELVRALPPKLHQLPELRENLNTQTRKVKELTTQLKRAVSKDKELVATIAAMEDHFEQIIEQRYQAELEERHTQVVELSRRAQEIEREKETACRELEAARNEIAAAVADRNATIINVKRTLEKYEELLNKLTHPDTLVHEVNTADTIMSILEEHMTQHAELSEPQLTTVRDGLDSVIAKAQRIRQQLPSGNDSGVIYLTPQRRKQVVTPSSVKITC